MAREPGSKPSNGFSVTLRVLRDMIAPGFERRLGERVEAKRSFAAMAALAMVLGFAGQSALADDQTPPRPPGESTQAYSDPLAPFNEKMFWFNLKLDHYVLHPVASGYAA